MPRPRTFDHAAAIRLYETGLRPREVAEQLGAKLSSVESMLSKHRRRKAGEPETVYPTAKVVALVEPEKCTHTTCSSIATRILKNGQFRHHLALTKPGLTKLGGHGAPVCADCWHIATGRHQCTTDGCEDLATQRGKPCRACRDTAARAASPPPPDPSPFQNGPFRGPEPNALTRPVEPPTLDVYERRRLEQLARQEERKRPPEFAAARQRAGDASKRKAAERRQAQPSLEDQEPTVPTPITHTPPPPTEDEMAELHAAAARDLPPEDVPFDDPNDPRPPWPCPHCGEEVTTATWIAHLCPAPPPRLPDQLTPVGPGEYTALDAERELVRVNVSREGGSDWAVSIEKPGLELFAVCPTWVEVAMMLSEFLSDRVPVGGREPVGALVGR